MSAPREGHPFHVGQRVRCIRSHEVVLSLIAGQDYTVRWVGTLIDFLSAQSPHPRAVLLNALLHWKRDPFKAVVCVGLRNPWPDSAADFGPFTAFCPSRFRSLNETEQSDAVTRCIDLHFRDFLNTPAPVEGEDA